MEYLDINKGIEIDKITEEYICILTMEECGELIQAISKILRGVGDYKNVCEEIADVLICLNWLKEQYDLKNEDLQTWLDYKIARCKQRIVEGNFY